MIATMMTMKKRELCLAEANSKAGATIVESMATSQQIVAVAAKDSRKPVETAAATEATMPSLKAIAGTATSPAIEAPTAEAQRKLMESRPTRQAKTRRKRNTMIAPMLCSSLLKILSMMKTTMLP
mgnify:CR=1 FL=1